LRITISDALGVTRSEAAFSRVCALVTSPISPINAENFAKALTFLLTMQIGKKKRELQELPKVLGEWWGVS